MGGSNQVFSRLLENKQRNTMTSGIWRVRFRAKLPLLGHRHRAANSSPLF
jgi:anti-anti-sigma regulatory factor